MNGFIDTIGTWHALLNVFLLRKIESDEDDITKKLKQLLESLSNESNSSNLFFQKKHVQK